MRALILILLCMTAFACKRTASADQTKQDFERLYAQWLVECKQPDVAIMSDARAYTSLPSCRAIVAMGPRVLPYIHEKMTEDVWAANILVHAAAEIQGTEPPPPPRPKKT